MDWSSLGASLALDNVATALALAPICLRTGRFRLLVLWFAGAEAVAPPLGALLPSFAPPIPIEAALLVTLAAAVLGLGLARRPDAERRVARGPAIAALALLLGLDNLLAGAALPMPVAVASGLASGGTVLAACGLGWLAWRSLPPLGTATLGAAVLLAAGLAA